MTGSRSDDLSPEGSDDPARDHGGDPPFRSAEEWLAERGIERDPIRVRPPRPSGDDDDSTPRATPPGSLPEPGPDEPSHDAAGGPVVPAPSSREAGQLATELPPAVPGMGHDTSPAGAADTTTEPGPLSDEVSRAVAFIQRSTATTPASTGRLERKLRDRDVPATAIRLALARAAEQGMVDDRALAAALVTEGREKGHAPRRLRADLRKREFDDAVIDAALGEIGDRDPEAVAFDVAQRKARSYRGLDAETAFRRLVGHLARRGHNEHVARKVARQVVFDDRNGDW